MTSYEINNITIEVEIKKPTGGIKKKYPFVLVRGLGSQLIGWPDDFINNLLEDGYTVYTFDNRDVGLSEKFDQFDKEKICKAISEIKTSGVSSERPYDLYDMVEDIYALLETFSLEKVHLVGISMGGAIAQIFAQKYLNRLASLTLIFTSTFQNTLPEMSDEAMYYFTAQPKSNSAEDIIKCNAESGFYFGSPKLGLTYEKSYSIAKKSFERCYNSDGGLRQFIALKNTALNVEKNRNITVPVLILHGDSDPIFSVEHAISIEQSIPNSNLIIIKDWGHDFPDLILNDLSKYIIENAEL